MPYATLNGWTISAAEGDHSRERIGDEARAIDGSRLMDLRTVKRTFQHRTAPMTPTDMHALIGLLEGRGWVFPYNTDVHSSNGQYAENGTVANLMSGTAADGASVLDHNGTAMAKFGAASLEVDGGASTTNRLTTNQANGGEDGTTTGFATPPAGGTISNNNTHKWQGTRSIRCVTPGLVANEGVETTDFNVAGAGLVGVPFTASVFVKVISGSTVSMQMIIRGDGVPVEASQVAAIPPGVWRRMSCTVNAVASNNIRVRVRTNATAACEFCIDGLQLESNKTYPTAWDDPSDGARVAGALQYNFNPGSRAGVTINCWATRSGGDSSHQEYLAVLKSSVSGNPGVHLTTGQGAPNEIRLGTIDENGVSDTLTYTIPDGGWGVGWRMITAVVRGKADTGHALKQIYVDGVLVASSSPATSIPDMITFDRVYVGNNAGTAWRNGRIDDMTIAPYVWAPGQIAAFYAWGRANSALPDLRLEGDIIPDPYMECHGQVVGISPTRFVDRSGVWRNNGGTVSWRLLER